MVRFIFYWHSMADNSLPCYSLHPAIYSTRRHQRCSHGASDHDQCLQDCICAPDNRCDPKLSVCTSRQERQVSGAHNRQAHGQYASGRGMQSRNHDGSPRKSNPGFLQCSSRQPLRRTKYTSMDSRESRCQGMRHR
jgi:hypothetical protein